MKKQTIYSCILGIFFVLQGCNTYKNLKGVEEPETWLETVITNTGKIECHVMVLGKEIKPDIENEYYWYDQNRIEITRGYSGGRLLHGETRVYDKNDKLLEKQEYKEGLKEGIWVSFFSNGKTKTIAQYKKGKLNGKMFVYGEDGILISETHYRNGEEGGKEDNEIQTDSTTTKPKQRNKK